MMVENGLNVNEIDIYGQNAIYYAINNGKLATTKAMHQIGSTLDHVDDNG
jgi:ankyrin repeat protein